SVSARSARRKAGSRPVEHDRFVEALERVRLWDAVTERVADAFAHRLGHQDLARLGDALHAGSRVHHRADRRQIAMRAAELAEAHLAALQADADAELEARLLLARGEALLEIARRQQRL